ncbi:unnamed protein product [Protopolystoma xenopodis]|uniref:Uncharacterized protein n=1 Tax=Protopolystoma xenopodis TaxID=117903 RepID=A0A3S5A1J6_9PLAT|nr:unnamed protein product [Protopolystoma xenopodis]
MSSSSDDVHHMLDENPARFQPKRVSMSCGLRKPERRIYAKRLRYNAIHPSSSGEIDIRIYFHPLSYEMEVFPIILLVLL